MRNLFTDGKNSVWHVLFGMIGYYYSYVVIIFFLYQMVTEKSIFHSNMFIDMSEFLVGYISVLCTNTYFGFSITE